MRRCAFDNGIRHKPYLSLLMLDVNMIVVDIKVSGSYVCFRAGTHGKGPMKELEAIRLKAERDLKHAEGEVVRNIRIIAAASQEAPMDNITDIGKRHLDRPKGEAEANSEIIEALADRGANAVAVRFSNPGLIDLDALTTMGVSVKAAGSIGYFGTGLKFAVATILRNGGHIKLCRGRDVHHFGTVRKDIRGEPFDIVTLDGRQLGFTTQTGRNWKPWMAYRELASNCFDEGGDVDTGRLDGLYCADNQTTFLVRGGDIERAHEDRDLIFIPRNETPAVVGGAAEAYRMSGPNCIYYRRVRVTEPTASLFRYNVTRSIDLTEDRTAKYSFEWKEAVAAMWLSCSDSALVRQVLCADDDILEADLPYGEVYTSKVSAAFIDTVEALYREGRTIRPSVEKAYTKATKKPSLLPSESVRLLAHEQRALDDALHFLERAGYPARDFPLVVAESLGDGVQGRAHNGTIYIAKRAFMGGDLTLAGTILEEWVHITTGHKDMTRSIQNWLVDAVMSQAKRADHAERRIEEDAA